MESILVASPDSAVSTKIAKVLASTYHIDFSGTLTACGEAFEQRRYEFTFIDLKLLRDTDTPGTIREYQKILQRFWRVFPMAQLIVVSSQDQLREVVKVVKAGAANYLTTPINAEELQYILESTDESTRIQLELDYLRDRFWQNDSLDVVHTNSSPMKQVFEKVRSVAPTRTTVLLLGETGVGKGVVAKLIHRHSDRQDQPFIHVHCGAIPENLVESELFGHEKGAFTGATKRRLGRFEIAKGGTIFLDEIGTISPSTQIKMLQVLQDRIFLRVGGEAAIETDVRIIAASNYDLRTMCDAGGFRVDLYYRLSVFPLEIPPMRERLEDIPYFARYFLEKLNNTHQKDIFEIHPLVLEAMQEYSWPGNIREFENIMERAFIIETSSTLTPESFPQEFFNLKGARARVNLDSSLSLAEVRRRSIEQIERQYLKELLSVHHGKINHTAAAAGISTRQLHKLLTRYGIQKEEFKPPVFS
ncbi:MAG: sigma-54 dependent transcriptional regulator [bacterium]